MMVCTQCGFQNETEDAFCGSCGAFLEWAGEKVETDAPAPVAAASPVVETPAAAPPDEPPTPVVEPEPAAETTAASPLLFPPGPTSSFRGEEPAPAEAEAGTKAVVDLQAEGIVAICQRGRDRQAIGILELPLPDPAPEGGQRIAAYRHWAGR